MAALCLRLGGLLNQAEVGRDIGLPATTVQRYINLLEISWQVVLLPAYHVNRTRRMIKAPKAYWSDTGLAMHLAGESVPRGAHLENLVLTDLLAWASGIRPQPTISHWRTNTGAEVDFVVELPGRLARSGRRSRKRAEETGTGPRPPAAEASYMNGWSVSDFR